MNDDSKHLRSSKARSPQQEWEEERDRIRPVLLRQIETAFDGDTAIYWTDAQRCENSMPTFSDDQRAAIQAFSDFYSEERQSGNF